MAKGYSSDRVVARRYGINRATVWRWSGDPKYAYLGFPPPIRFGPNTTRWSNNQLDQFDAERQALSDDA